MVCQQSVTTTMHVIKSSFQLHHDVCTIQVNYPSHVLNGAPQEKLLGRSWLAGVPLDKGLHTESAKLCSTATG